MMPDKRDFDTLAAQAGLRQPIGDAYSTAPPIDASTTFTYDSIAQVHDALLPEPKGFAYGRNANPTVAALEQVMAQLESAEDVVAFGSGMAAINGALTGLQLWPGDTVVAGGDLYGVTRSLLTDLAQYEIQTRFVDTSDLPSVEQALEESRPRALFWETITNPLLRVPDSLALIALAHDHGALAIVDNTFATPYLFRPLEHGADLVVHSATKYIAGHGDAVAGLVAGSYSLGRQIRDRRTVHGSILSPFEAWLTMRGIRTLPLRITRQSESAAAVSSWLSEQPWVERVYFPGLPDHPGHGAAERQLGGLFGGMVAFDLRATQEQTLRFLDGLEIIISGTSLGDVESLALYPPLSSHRTLSPEQRRDIGIGDGLVRLSVGLESVDDLIVDLGTAAARSGIRAAFAASATGL